MRFYCQSIHTESFLDPIESGHLCRVLRAKKGTPLELFDGQGTLAEGVVERADTKRTIIQIQKIMHTPAPTAGRIILAVSFAKGQRFDWLVEKCTELGVDHIAAVHFEHTVKLGKDGALERYRKIAIAAAKQSKRLFLPAMTGPQKFSDTVTSLIGQYPQGILLFGDPKGVPISDLPLMKDGQDYIVVVGPEGGLSEPERTLLCEKNATSVTVNRNVLRIETAAAAFCAMLAIHRF